MISFWANGWVFCAKCPPKDVLEPCWCRNEVVIICNGTHDIDLKNVFRNVSEAVKTSADKQYNTLIINNTAITEIVNKTFFDVTFKRIEIYAKSLRRIHDNAFADYNTDTIEEFHVFGDSNLGGDEYSDEVFTALSSLVNLRTVSFEETHLNRIQTRAFKLRTGAQNKLTGLDFGTTGGGDKTNDILIKSVGNYSFYYLKSLQSINLQNHRISRIGIHAFDIWKPSTMRMRISLINNTIDDKSIEIGAFSNAKRPLFIELGNNKLTYIEERIFGPVLRLSNQTTIYFDGNPFVCDCKMNWLRMEREFYENQIKYIVCLNYKSEAGTPTNFWDLSEKNFKECRD